MEKIGSLMIELESGPECTVICRPWGRLDLEGATPLRHVIADLAQPDVRLLLDLRHVDAVDAAGVITLVSSMRRMRSVGGTLQIVNANERVRWYLDVMGAYRPGARDSSTLSLGARC